MSEFLLVVPAGLIEISIDELSAAGVERTAFEKYETGTDLYEMTDALRIMGVADETQECNGIRYMPEFDRLWVLL